MGIAVSGGEGIRKSLNQARNMLHNETMRIFAHTGELAINHARSIPPDVGYRDITGNLRSSVGYGVFFKGDPVLRKTKTAKRGSEGAKIAQEKIENLAKGAKDDYLLIVVAGMEYAVHLEAKYGRDVLTSAEHLALRELKTALEKLKELIQKS